MATSPPALVQLTTAFRARPDRPKSYVMGGIVGDASHMKPVPEGYHVSYNDLGGQCSRYGLAFPGDCAAGKANPTFASAWDLSMNDADMILVTTRLINAAKAKDPRVSMLWEIAGTTNGQNVHAYYLNSNTDDPTNRQQWASSHMHHVHLSFRRDHVTNLASLTPLLDVICGVPLEEDMTPTELITALQSPAGQAAIETAAEKAVAKFLVATDGHQYGLNTIVQQAVKAQLAPVLAELAKLAAK